MANVLKIHPGDYIDSSTNSTGKWNVYIQKNEFRPAFFFYHNAQNTAPNEDLSVKPEMVEIAWKKKNSGGTLQGTSTGKD